MNKKIIIDSIEYELVPIGEKPRPPLGIKPEWIWKEERLNEIREAMARYVKSAHYYPKEWINEEIDLEDWLKKRENQKQLNISANELADKLSNWCWGKDVPTEITKLKEFFKRGLREI